MEAKLDEVSLLDLLRQRDEAAFTQLVEQYHPSLVRLAQIYVRDSTLAEEVAQETWLAILHGLDRFEARSSLKTWIFTILTNKAKTRSQREKRSSVFSDFENTDSDSPTVDPKRFRAEGQWENHWAAGPRPWEDIPEGSTLHAETMRLVREAIDALPENQRLVITLHDRDELSSDEICNVLSISETNQRVLLHRARAKVRQALEDYLQSEH